MDPCINPVFQLLYLLLIVHRGAQAHRVKMQRWAFGLECPSFKTIDKINKVKYVSSLFWLCSCSWSIPSSKLLQLSSVIAALSPRVYILNHCLPLSKLKSLAKHTTCCYLSGKPTLKKQPRLDTNSNSPILDHCAFTQKLEQFFIILEEVGQVDCNYEYGAVAICACNVDSLHCHLQFTQNFWILGLK